MLVLAKKGETVNAVKFEGIGPSVDKIAELVDGKKISITYDTTFGPVVNLPYGLKLKTGDYVLRDGNGRLSVESAWLVEGSYESIPTINGETSDGYHTFNELYYHRMMLFAVICNSYKEHAWKSWKHHDDTMYDDYFIVGLTTSEGDYSYHYHKQYWDMFEVTELDCAPEWDGHQPSDIGRLLSLLSCK